MKVSIVMVTGKTRNGKHVELPYVFIKKEKAIEFHQRQVLYYTNCKYPNWTQTGCYIFSIDEETYDNKI